MGLPLKDAQPLAKMLAATSNSYNKANSHLCTVMYTSDDYTFNQSLLGKTVGARATMAMFHGFTKIEVK